MISDAPGLLDERVNALYRWLLARNSDALPRTEAILAALPTLGSGGQVGNAFRSLARQGLIEQRHGTLRRASGHRIVRIVATGRVLSTEGCPLSLDDFSAEESRLALTALHDEGKLILVQRGMRWGAVLPDGRATL
jgi:hypothetical protein